MGESLECLIALCVEGATPEKEPLAGKWLMGDKGVGVSFGGAETGISSFLSSMLGVGADGWETFGPDNIAGGSPGMTGWVADEFCGMAPIGDTTGTADGIVAGAIGGAAG